MMRGLYRFDSATGAAAPDVPPRQPRDRLGLVVAGGGIVVLALAVWLIGRELAAVPPPAAPHPMRADEANAVLAIVQFELTAAARHDAVGRTATPTSAGPMEVYVVGIAPLPTNTPAPRKPTATPWPSCPQPGAVCAWPQPPAPTRIAPTPSPYPVCVTPIPGDRCRDTPGPAMEATPGDDCAIVQSGILLCTPAAGPSTADACGNPFGGPWPTLSPEFATITPTWATPTPNPACVTPETGTDGALDVGPTACAAIWPGWC